MQQIENRIMKNIQDNRNYSKRKYKDMESIYRHATRQPQIKCAFKCSPQRR